MKIDDAFGNWFAGFFDGEGYFYAAMVPNRCSRTGKVSRDALRFAMVIGLRADDSAILIECKKRFGGITSPCRRNGEDRYFQWRVTGQQCFQFLDFFCLYPLRAKKRNDFEIWSQIVEIAKSKAHLGSRREEVIFLCEELRRTRKFDATASPEFKSKDVNFQVSLFSNQILS